MIKKFKILFILTIIIYDIIKKIKLKALQICFRKHVKKSILCHEFI